MGEGTKRGVSLWVVAVGLLGLGGAVWYGLNQVTTTLAADVPGLSPGPVRGGGLLAAVERGDAAAAVAAIQAGANPDEVHRSGGTGGMTALMSAASRGQTNLMKALLDAGANANARSADGRTALMYAAGWGNAASVRLLLEAGARENERADDGMTALILASARGERDAVRALRDAGADVGAAHK
jgi:ankyrin repeat protein